MENELTLADISYLDFLVREHTNSKRHEIEKYHYLNQLRNKLLKNKKTIIDQLKETTQ